PGARTHAIERAPSPAGPWRRVGVYVPPAPATQPASGGTTQPPANSVQSNRTLVQAPAVAAARDAQRQELLAKLHIRVAFVDTTDLAPSTSYAYRVVALYDDRSTGPSAPVGVVTPAPPPVVDLGAAGERSAIGVRLMWNAAPGTMGHIAAYRVYKNGAFAESPTYTPVLGQPAQPLPLWSDFAMGMAGQSASYEVEPVYKLPGGGTVAGPRASVTGTSTKTREWCPAVQLMVKVQATAKPGGFDLVVSALDRGSQKPLAGTVKIKSGMNTEFEKWVSGPTGQPLSVTTCMRAMSTRNTTESPTACQGTVTVPGYPQINFAASAGANYTR
ncbi:MAG: hypothetical protein HOQ11_13420, partial [Gemmatimonadaceae bacterium]|nr:hypothetical protein [Gemmatimonadaceae bacterium]